MRLRMTPALVDVATTTLTSIAAAAATMLALRWLAHSLGVEGFGVYSIARRLVLTTASVTTVTMGVALPRFLGLQAGKKGEPRRPYLLAATAIAVGLSTFAALALLPLRTNLARWSFGDESAAPVVLASLFMLWGYVVFNIAYGYYRGVGKIRVANLWQLGATALGPMLIVIALGGAGVPAVVMGLGGLFAVAALPVSVLCLAEWRATRGRQFGSAAKELGVYGGLRVPEGFALTTLLSLGPLLAPFYADLKAAGFLLAAQSIFRVVEALIASFGFVALPRVAAWVSGGQQEKIRQSVGDLVSMIIQLGIFAAVQLLVWADVVVLTWLGPAYADAIPLMRVIVVALPAYLGYVMLASVINATETRPVTTITVVGALAAAAGLSVALGELAWGALGLALGTSLGLLLAGVASITFLAFRHRFAWLSVARTMILNAVLGAASWAAHAWVVRLSGLPRLALAGAAGLAVCSVYALFLWRWKMPWLRQITSRVHF